MHQSSPRGHIGKSSVVVVVIEMRSGCLVVWEALDGGAIGKVDVRPTVVVIVENDGAVPGGFDDEFFVGIVAVDVERSKSCLSGDVFEVNRARLHRG